MLSNANRNISPKTYLLHVCMEIPWTRPDQTTELVNGESRDVLPNFPKAFRIPLKMILYIWDGDDDDDLVV
jgi:hypothetical protein